MFTRIAMLALVLSLPLAACETEPDIEEGDTVTIEAPDVDGAMDDAANDIDEAADDAAAEIDEAAGDAGAAIDDAASDMEAEVDSL